MLCDVGVMCVYVGVMCMCVCNVRVCYVSVCMWVRYVSVYVGV